MIAAVITGYAPLVADVVIHPVGEIAVIRVINEALLIVIKMVISDAGIIRVPEIARQFCGKRIEPVGRDLISGKGSTGDRASNGVNYGSEGIINRTKRSIGGIGLRKIALTLQGRRYGGAITGGNADLPIFH